jgi:hypothetical protein
MAINTRQTGLLVAENWKKIYQTFQEADFTSYDFETLRKTMIDYLKVYYPEDFNDFIESSEFIALIDLIAFMGQSLAFRTDLNARESFIDTAERRDSILKLARLISYNPKRNNAASGYLKIDSVISSEVIFDSNGLNLSNLIVNWNDQTNDNWLEQITLILNAAIVSNQAIGNPGNRQTINGVLTEEYSLNLIQDVLGVYGFQSSIEGTTYNFEAVSASAINKDYVYERSPTTNGVFNILYRNDNYGNSSNDTGFFIFFKQGTLSKQDFSIAESIPNRIVTVNSANINNTDVWVYAVDSNNQLSTQWSAVPAVTGINVIYNNSQLRNLYQVNTLAGDQIDLVFGDGSFANVPMGNFRVYYRVSNGLTYKITPDEMKGITLVFPYISRENRVEQITIRASLQYTVSNASARETSDEIRQKAPQQYYTQNRMITGEDYNILPYTNFGNVIKVKSINRTSSGLSRYLDVIDSTGKYSSTNIFCDDGVIYKNDFIRTLKFSFNTLADVLSAINTQVLQKISSREMMHFFYNNYPKFQLVELSRQSTASENSPIQWQLSTIGSNETTGYFKAFNQSSNTFKPVQVSGATNLNARYIRKGAIVRFVPADGFQFDGNNNMIQATIMNANSYNYIYAGVLDVFGDGTNDNQGNFSNGTGPVVLNVKVPAGAVADIVYPMFANNLTNFFIQNISNNILSFNNFGVTYDIRTQTWRLINDENLNYTKDFDLDMQLDTSGRSQDASWLIRFEYSPAGYTVYYRGIEYVFHSLRETTFYFDETTKIFDTKTGTTVHDQIKIFKTNTQSNSSVPIGQDLVWYIFKNYIESDGYINKNKIYITYADTNSDGVPDNPDLFASLVDTVSDLVYFKISNDQNNNVLQTLVDNAQIESLYATLADINDNKDYYTQNQLFYAFGEGKFYQLNSQKKIILQTNYIVKIGRQNIAFQYKHNSSAGRRIDPSSTNIIDIYMLTSAYERDFRSWIQDITGTVAKPTNPTAYDLAIEFSSLNSVKSISDTIIFNAAKYKMLFGNNAPTSLQATFKVVKNPLVNISDNDIKTSVIAAINTYFDIANWDFGETFYFSELSAYLHRILSPNIASVMIVPQDVNVSFGNLYQINAEPNEIITSAATVDNVEIVSAVTLAGLNLASPALNKQLTI